MRCSQAKAWSGLLACLFIVGLTVPAWSAEPAKSSDKILVAKTFRSSKLIGLNVRNPKGEKLGTVNDMVVNVENGKVNYIALSVGGILGVGNKLFAVPFDQMKFDHGKDEMFFVLNMTPEQLHAAPGFDQNDWPDFADPHWAEKIDNYYRQAETKTRVETRTETRTKTTK